MDVLQTLQLLLSAGMVATAFLTLRQLQQIKAEGRRRYDEALAELGAAERLLATLDVSNGLDPDHLGSGIVVLPPPRSASS